MTKALFFAAAVAALSTQVSAQQPAPAHAHGGHGGWRHADQTRAQAQQRADMLFQRLDANRDGTVTRQEAEQAAAKLSSTRGQERSTRFIERLFSQGDRVTQAQFQAQALARFDRQDLNHDGTVTAAERPQREPRGGEE
jgi:Skp family chaperone for outer membrane proteins